MGVPQELATWVVVASGLNLMKRATMIDGGTWLRLNNQRQLWLSAPPPEQAPSRRSQNLRAD